MAITNQERIGKALDLLRQGLAPFVEREVQAAVKAGTVQLPGTKRAGDHPAGENRVEPRRQPRGFWTLTAKHKDA
jgi:hypothetical protein